MKMPGAGKTEKMQKTSNPFDGAAEMDILKLTERVLNDDCCKGYVTSDGRVMPRNEAFHSGVKDGIELVKERVWG